MPQRKNAAKRLRIDKKKKSHNLRMKTTLKKEIKSLRALLDKGDVAEAKKKLRKVFQVIDRATAKGIIHKKTAARRKSSFALRLNKPA